MAEKSKDFHEILVNKFTEESAREFREDFLAEAGRNKVKPIIVCIDTLGGSISALATMVETIESVPNEVITACIGQAISAGAILLSCGNYRFAGMHSRVAVHEFLTKANMANVHEISVAAKEALRINKYWLGLLAKNCKIPGGFVGLKKILKEREDDRIIYMNAQEALKFGIIDYIGIPKVNTKKTYEIENVVKKK